MKLFDTRSSHPGSFVTALVLLLALLAAGAAAAGPVVSIVSPQPEQTIHDNTGQVQVSVMLENGEPLRARGGAIRVLLDGQPFGSVHQTRSFVLQGVERGEHTLQVQLLDPSGNLLAASAPVKFYMWQASRLMPHRR